MYSDSFDHFNGRLVAAEAVLAVGKSAKSTDCTLLTLQYTSDPILNKPSPFYSQRANMYVNRMR